ncbi:MAG TPA: ATP-binding protein [Nocardioidaceae bacterium]|nr:ATP-binding protein [Nocardioidaceae bacterium]
MGFTEKIIEHLPGHPSAARMARTHVGSLCAGLRIKSREDAILLTSEIVTNAIQHANGPIRLTVIRLEDGLRVEVHDTTGGTPAVAHRGMMAENGRGLALLAALASDWGSSLSRPVGTGKTVWFEIHDPGIP